MNVETPLITQFAYFALCGVFLGLGYEVLRILRACVPHCSFVVGIEDTLYLALCGLILFGFSMEIGSGRFRLFYLVFALLGAVLYYFTAGKLIRLVYLWIIKAVKFVLKSLYKVICRPVAKLFVFIAHKCSVPFVKIHKNFLSASEKYRKRLQLHIQMMYNNKNDLSEGNGNVDRKAPIKAKIKKE